MKDDRVYLTHILDCIQRIEDYTRGEKLRFLESTLIQDGVVRNLQTLAESTQRLSETLKTSYPKTDWRAISGFRNVLVHNYLGLDLERIWEVIEIRLEPLKKDVVNMLDEIEDVDGAEGVDDVEDVNHLDN